ncbi:adenylyltransferase/cytidyltransferase family protein [Vibrio sp. 506]|uniref:adenylyltransferase/cytidyltransferase family protein n=1 Tax=Vibrio sp. 506 TaxID=3074607 RepID=UPI00296556FD|nr:adenylyltransferase/cytidyltransferase family protein [Vibrio sp. 506]MDW2056799.1 adenylyltransferase/cytidyltransferase family protein [Vibrio sp. 506]
MKKRVVYVSGTFDLFHSNHLKMIEYGRGLGDILIVGVSTDELVCTYKNPPAVPFEERIAIVNGLKAPDVVVPQHTLEHASTVKNLNVDCFVIGDDWVGKYDYLKELGVEVYYLPYGKGVSTTNLKKKIYKDYKKLIELSDNHPIPMPQES